MAIKPELYWDILDKKRSALLPKLRLLRDGGFYLAGGTALALHIRHRISVDFDFYNRNKFDSSKVYQMLETQRPLNLLLDTMAEDTLIVEANGISVSLFAYSYPLLKPCIASKYVNVASLEDIAAMKLVAIIQRGIKRDFIDLYFLSQLIGMEEMMDLAKKKYPGFNGYLACQALVYFRDAEKNQTGKIKMLKPLSWENVRKYFEEEVAQLKRKWLQHEK
jgi:predicted nucleotidyltransferase component of viral defense system